MKSEIHRNGYDLPLVSVITPTYNRANFIRATIESVLKQTYPQIEYIVIDDGSTDETRELCAEYSNLKYFYQKNSGQSSAINNGWSRASGQYLMYLSSDDLLKPNAVAELVKSVQEQPREIIAYPNYDVIDQNGVHQADVVLGPFLEERFFNDLNCVLGPAVLFNKSLFERHGGWDRRLRQVPDYEYWLRLSQDAHIVNVPVICASSRAHKSAISYSRVSLKRSLEIVRIVRKYIVSRHGTCREEILAKAYTTSMRYHLRAMQFRTALRFACKIWKQHRPHVFRINFLRAVIGETYHTAVRNAIK